MSDSAILREQLEKNAIRNPFPITINAELDNECVSSGSVQLVANFIREDFLGCEVYVWLDKARVAKFDGDTIFRSGGRRVLSLSSDVPYPARDFSTRQVLIEFRLLGGTKYAEFRPLEVVWDSK